MKRLSALLIVSTMWTGVAVTQTAKNSSGNVYEKWLSEDVRWIITPQERDDYMHLSNNRDRDRFIEQFWLKRDPTPDTRENEFKEEHYRRIAYANVHFGDGFSGWETDRGRVYIVYGPPQQIEPVPRTVSDHPISGTVWRYRDGRVFKFSDSCDCGDYRLPKPTAQ